MTTGKTIALTQWTFVDKVMSLLFNMPSRLVITFLPRSKHILISWLQLPPAVILGPPKIKSATVSTVSHLFAHTQMIYENISVKHVLLSKLLVKSQNNHDSPFKSNFYDSTAALIILFYHPKFFPPVWNVALAIH